MNSCLATNGATAAPGVPLRGAAAYPLSMVNVQLAGASSLSSDKFENLQQVHVHVSCLTLTRQQALQRDAGSSRAFSDMDIRLFDAACKVKDDNIF